MLAAALAAIAPVAAAAQASTPPTPPPFVTRAAAAADLEQLFRTIESVHPDPYTVASRAAIAREREAVLRALPDSVTRPELYLRFAPLVAMLGDGHTNLNPPSEEWAAANRAGAPILPFRMTVDPVGQLRVSLAAPDAPIRAGDAVVAIGGTPVAELLDRTMASLGGELLAWRRRNAAGFLPRHLWMRGVRGPFEVTVRRDGEPAPLTFRLDGLRLDSLDALARAQATARGGAGAPRDLEYRTLPGRVGYLEFRTMTAAPDDFAPRIAALMRQAVADSIGALVVDLRRNGGGNSQLGELLLQHLTGAPFRMAARKEWKMSAEYRAMLRARAEQARRQDSVRFAASNGETELRRLLEGPDGRLIVSESNARVRPRLEPRFDGPVCVLIGPGTFSSAMMTANAIQDYRLATLIGEETGGVPTSFGEQYSFRLANSQLPASVSSARFVRASGDASVRAGVVPDIEVRPTAADLRAGRDPVLERAMTCPARPTTRR
ncbi:hypothetical protein rosag_30220 [Roseisolibacter agri]|uniref:Tail specific protease domain-containing protein n=1 Tax=Roseisolibacter agri TaxID=2014610 RepID=A0AA37Q4N0_9BACT|nr:hypothetical protein rosag_30220 [Roseisolibacter agri]